MTDLVQSKVENHVLTLTLNRPDKRNALTFAMYQKLADAITAANTNPEIRCVLLHGAGDSFTSGNDLVDFMGLSQGARPFDENLEVMQMMQAILLLEKPFVVAVHGDAVGIGSTLLFHADVIIGTPSAKFNLAFTQLGLAPEFASSMRLADIVGIARARHILMLSEAFSGEQAFEWGIVTQFVAEDALMTAAEKACQKLVNLPARSLRDTKRLLRQGSGHADINAMIKAESEVWAAALKSPEFMEAAMAFMQKRKPDFLQFD